MADGYSNTSSSVSAGSGCASANVTVPVSGLTPNTRYRAKIAADNTSGSLGGRTLSAEFFFTTLTTCGTPGAPPTLVDSAPAVALTETSVQVSIHVNPNGVSTSILWQFALAADFSGTLVTATTPAGSGCVSTNVTQTLDATAFTANTTYYARAVATSTGNGGGSVTSSSTTFLSPGSPTVTTKAADGITTTSATLHGTENNHGAASHWYFEYSKGTSYGSHTASTPHGANTSGQPTTVTINGLTTGTTYHVRLRSSRDDGGGSAIDDAPLTFTTN